MGLNSKGREGLVEGGEGSLCKGEGKGRGPTSKGERGWEERRGNGKRGMVSRMNTD